MREETMALLRSECRSDQINIDEDMSRHVSFKAGGRASVMIRPENAQQLAAVIGALSANNETYMVMGNGSNLLFTDEGYDGAVVMIDGSGFGEITVDGDTIRTGAGALLSQVARAAAREGLAGFEFASGIPGSVGGGLFMNAGAYGGEMKDIVKCATVLSAEDGDIRTVGVSEMELAYRHSAFMKSGEIIIDVTYQLRRGSQQEIEDEMRELMNRRNSKQPVNFPSAGSFFKRPEGHFAGKLIEDAGLKGLKVGGAQVSELHAGFIINRGGATAGDIIDLMHIVQNVVYENTDVRLEPEVRIIGG